MPDAKRVPTGNAVLDTLLGGGIPSGSVLLVKGEEGAGAPEFALSILHGVVKANMGHAARFATALRSPVRVEAELAALFPESKSVGKIEVRPIPFHAAADGNPAVLEGLGEGGVVALESASAMGRRLSPERLLEAIPALGNVARGLDISILLVHTTGALDAGLEVALGEACDGVFEFAWRDGGTSRRRIMTLRRLRGLTPILEQEEVPVFEVALQRGVGFTLSRVKNVV